MLAALEEHGQVWAHSVTHVGHEQVDAVQAAEGPCRGLALARLGRRRGAYHFFPLRFGPSCVSKMPFSSQAPTRSRSLPSTCASTDATGASPNTFARATQPEHRAIVQHGAVRLAARPVQHGEDLARNLGWRSGSGAAGRRRHANRTRATWVWCAGPMIGPAAWAAAGSAGRPRVDHRLPARVAGHGQRSDHRDRRGAQAAHRNRVAEPDSRGELSGKMRRDMHLRAVREDCWRYTVDSRLVCAAAASSWWPVAVGWMPSKKR